MENNDLALILTAVFAIGFGILDCFVGYHIFRLVLSIIGFIVGASIGLALTPDSPQLTQILVAVVGGIIGAVLMNVLYFLGIVIAGALLGALLTNILLGTAGVEPGAIFLVIGAVIGGAIALVLNKLMIILSTAFSGAASIVYGVSLLIPSLGGFDPLGALSRVSSTRSEPSALLLAAWIILGLAGAGIQYRASELAEDEPVDAPA